MLEEKDKKRIALILTVGKSLEENYLDESEVVDGEKKKIKELREKKKKELYTNSNYENTLKEFLSTNNAIKKCAEINELERFFERSNDKLQNAEIDIYLIGTKSQGESIIGSEAIAKIIRDYLEEEKEKPSLPGLSQMKERIKKIDVSHSIPDPFRSEDKYFVNSLNEWIKAINNIISPSEEKRNKDSVGIQRYDSVFIFISGGYKGFIPFITLLSTLYRNVWLVYIHEESKEPFFIPPLPFSFDLLKIDSIRSIMAHDSLKKETFKALEKIFPFVSSLFSREDEEYKSTEFKKILRERYNQLKIFRSYAGEDLLRMIENKEIREKIEEKMNYWNYLWIGDQIPETVEHSKFHSLRLLEYANIIMSFYPELKEKLKDKGLAILFTSIWLHDIGHGALHFKKEKLPPESILWFFKDPKFRIPSAIAHYPHYIRDYHHFLTVYMLETDFKFLLPEFPSELKDACKLAMLYHRKDMPLRPDSSSGRKSLQEIIQEKENLKKEEESIILASALLRFIDALDVQSDRVGSKEYLEVRNRRTEYEINYHREMVREGREEAEELWKLWNDQKDDEIKNMENKVLCLCDYHLKRLHFLMLQRFHYYTHFLIDTCLVEKGKDDTLEVSFLINEDMKDKLNKDKLNKLKAEEYINKSKKNLEEEWKGVKKEFEKIIKNVKYYKIENGEKTELRAEEKDEK